MRVPLDVSLASPMYVHLDNYVSALWYRDKNSCAGDKIMSGSNSSLDSKFSFLHLYLDICGKDF